MTDEARPNQPVPDSQRLPWEREQGWLPTFFSTTARILFAPSSAFALRPAGAYYKPWLYAFLASLLGGLAGQAAGLAFGGNPGYATLLGRLPLQVLWAALGLGGLAIFAWAAHVLLRSKTAPAPYWATARVLAYTAAVTMLYAPLSGALGGLFKGQESSPGQAMALLVIVVPFAVWGVYLQCLGLDILHGKGKWRTFFVLLLIDIVFGIISLFLLVFFAMVMAGFGARP